VISHCFFSVGQVFGRLDALALYSLKRKGIAKTPTAAMGFFRGPSERPRGRPRLVLISGRSAQRGFGMQTHSPKEITRLLVAWGEGDESALEDLTPLVYEELHRLAHRYMGRELAGHTLQTTALVNEAYVRLIDWRNVR